MKTITCFILNGADAAATSENLKKCPLVGKVAVTDSLRSSVSIRRIAEESSTEFTLLYTKTFRLDWVHWSLERMVQVARDTGAAMLYSDHFIKIEGEVRNAPVIDCQSGSLRDDFDFGSVLLFRTDVLKAAAATMTENYIHAGLYDLRLKVSRIGRLEHINEYLYYEVETDSRKSGEKQFDYAPFVFIRNQ